MNEVETEGQKPGGCGCAACSGEGANAEQFVYAIGRLEVRFPTVGVEREFQQRERALDSKASLPASRAERIKAVLRENPHLWSRVCFVLSIGQVPAYIVAPSSQHTLHQLLEGASRHADRNTFVTLIGRRAGIGKPGQCGGLLAPIAICDQLYVFSVDEWLAELSARVEPALKEKGGERGHFTTVAREFFDQVASSTENVGGLDTHRALNYVLVQHPGLALSVAERPKSVLDRIETRLVHGTDLRKVVAVILTFVARATGVPERLFCRVDVTEEWPFLVESQETSIPVLGLMPYIDNAQADGAILAMKVAAALTFAPSDFATHFRAALDQYVEYSVDADPARLGIMIFGDGNFLDELQPLVHPIFNGREWLSGVQRFSAATKPVSYLLKTDWSGDTLLAVSLYCRFIENLPAKEVGNALEGAQPLSWQGPPIEEIGRTVGTSWPHGIGFRVTANGEFHSSVYHRIAVSRLQFQTQSILDLVKVCGFPESLEKVIHRDCALVYGPGPIGVVGVDAEIEGRSLALKLDVERVPLNWAVRYIRSRGISPSRLQQIRALAVSLGVKAVGYLGLKYSGAGFDSWKVYLPQQPRLRPKALAPRLNVNQWARAT